MSSFLLRLLSVGIVALAVSCANKPYPVMFHMESDSHGEGGLKFSRPFKGKYYDVTPFASTQMFKQYASFVNPDGSYGAQFLVEDEWRMRIQQLTTAKKGKTILPTVNGLGMERMLIDKPITDGILVIWSGLNGYDLKMINESIDAANIAIEKPRFLDDDPRPRPKINKPKNTSNDLIRHQKASPDQAVNEIPEG